MTKKKSPDFWTWLIEGTGGRPGIERVINRWIIIDLLIGWAVSDMTPSKLSDIGKTVVLPVAAVFIGLAVSWSANAYVLVSSNSIRKLSSFNPGGYCEYFFPFQLAILTFLISIGFWGIAAVGALDSPSHLLWVSNKDVTESSARIVGFMLLSLSFRTAWKVVNLMSVTLYYIKLIEENSDEKTH